MKDVCKECTYPELCIVWFGTTTSGGLGHGSAICPNCGNASEVNATQRAKYWDGVFRASYTVPDDSF